MLNEADGLKTQDYVLADVTSADGKVDMYLRNLDRGPELSESCGGTPAFNETFV